MPERPTGRAPRLRAGRVGNEGKRKFATLESFLKLPGVPKPAAGATVTNPELRINMHVNSRASLRTPVTFLCVPTA